MAFDADQVFEVVSERLPEAGIDFLMIGGHAVNYYGYVRATQDIDFMVAASDEQTLRDVMSKAGFTNIASHENVIFFSRPDSPLRVDFLKVNRETMDKLLANATAIDYFEGHTIRVPQLRDLLAMKIFALKSGKVERDEKDLPDIAHLVVEHGLDVEEVLKPLCDEFGSVDIYNRLCERIARLKND